MNDKIITQIMIDKYIEAQIKINDLKNNWFNNKAKEICYILGHSGFDGIKYISDGEVCCDIYYSGCGNDDFYFPIKLLLMNDNETKEYKKEQNILKKKKEKQRIINTEKQRLERQKELYLKLKEKFSDSK